MPGIDRPLSNLFDALWNTGNRSHTPALDDGGYEEPNPMQDISKVFGGRYAGDYQQGLGYGFDNPFDYSGPRSSNPDVYGAPHPKSYQQGLGYGFDNPFDYSGPRSSNPDVYGAPHPKAYQQGLGYGFDSPFDYSNNGGALDGPQGYQALNQDTPQPRRFTARSLLANPTIAVLLVSNLLDNQPKPSP